MERVTELTFTREERQQQAGRQQESAGHDTTGTATSDTGNNEETMEEMLFGPRGIFSTFVPIVVDVDTGRETEGTDADNGQDNNANNTVEEDAEGHATRRESFGHNLVHNVIPRVLRTVLHRNNRPRDEQRDGTTTTNEQDMNDARRGDSTRIPSFDFTNPSGRRARIAIFAGHSYKSCLCN